MTSATNITLLARFSFIAHQSVKCCWPYFYLLITAQQVLSKERPMTSARRWHTHRWKSGHWNGVQKWQPQAKFLLFLFVSTLLKNNFKTDRYGGGMQKFCCSGQCPDSSIFALRLLRHTKKYTDEIITKNWIYRGESLPAHSDARSDGFGSFILKDLLFFVFLLIS